MLFKTVPGKLYVIGEEDVFGGPTSPYFKIGIVRDEREVDTRLKEHQTGNPRKLVIRALVEAAAVEYLETHLHHRLATKIAFSEWFRLAESEFAELINTAQQLAQALEAQVPLVERAAALENVVSNGEKAEPDSSVTSLHESLLPESLRNRKIDAAMKQIATTIRSRQQQTPDEGPATPVGGGRLVLVDVARFDQSSCLAENPHLTDAFRKVKVDGRFLLAKHPTIEAAIKDLDPLKEHLSLKPEDLDKLSDRELEQARRGLDEVGAHTSWGHTHHQAAIRSAVGNFDALVGIATWKRVEKVSFDVNAFKAAEPELHSKYVTITQVQRMIAGNQGLAEAPVEE